MDEKSKSPKFEARNDEGSLVNNATEKVTKEYRSLNLNSGINSVKESEKGTPLAKKKSPIIQISKTLSKLNEHQRSEMREAKREEREEIDV